MSVGKIIFNIIIISLLFQSCSPGRRLGMGDLPTGKPEGGDYGSLAVSRNISGKDLIISRARIKYSTDNVSRSVNAFIKYNRKKELLLSLRSIAGIEVTRVFIGRDSIKIHDRINNTLYIQSLDYLSASYGIGARDLVLLWGDMPQKIGRMVSEQGESDKKVYRITSSGTDYEIVMDTQWHKISKALLKYGENNQSEMTFYNFVNDKGLTYPENAELFLSRGNISIELKYSGVKRDRIKSMKFSPSKTARVIVLK